MDDGVKLPLSIMNNESDIEFMKLALKEAVKGIGRTSPNPAVGAVIVNNKQVVGRGYHHRDGAPHAEINALKDAGSKAKNSTLYVTLEPCNHTGRTPPCTQAIVKSGIKRVVVGMIDPNPLVTGNGCDFLVKYGISVSSGILDEQCAQLNRPFIKHSISGLPWVIMKAAVSLDGMIAVRTGHSCWITGRQSRHKVHQLRDRVDAIVVGIGTALADNPALTTRLPKKRGSNPLRIVLDTRLRLSSTARLFNQPLESEVWLFCGPEADRDRVKRLTAVGAKVKVVNLKKNRLDLAEVLVTLGKAQITSLLVEGGSGVHSSFLEAGLVDEVNIFVAPLFIGADGIPLINKTGFDTVQDGYRFQIIRTQRLGSDVLINGLFVRENELI